MENGGDVGDAGVVEGGMWALTYVGGEGLKQVVEVIILYS